MAMATGMTSWPLGSPSMPGTPTAILRLMTTAAGPGVAIAVRTAVNRASRSSPSQVCTARPWPLRVRARS